MNWRFWRRQKTRAEPGGAAVLLSDPGAWDALCCQGYTNLAHNPEIAAGVDTIAKLIASMTIHLMENTDSGDVRVRDELARKVDVEPCSTMTRSTFIQWLVRTLMLDGNGNCVVYPVTRRGYLRDLRPIPSSLVSFMPDGDWDYKVLIGGAQYDPDDVLHFVLNPDSFYPWKGTGYRVSLSDVANNLKQAAKTERGFMESKWKPSLIIKVDALTEEFSSPEGRAKLLDEYVSTARAGEPWMIPAEQFSVEQVKPLTLSDLALSDMVTLDKRTVASILGVPPFVLGVGDFQREAWNNFISSTIMPLAKAIEQEFTKKLLYSPSRYFRFNSRSLYNYDLQELAAVADDQFVRGIMTGNEVRDWIGLSPVDGLNELVILENYIPRGMIGDQNKLNGGGE